MNKVIGVGTVFYTQRCDDHQLDAVDTRGYERCLWPRWPHRGQTLPPVLLPLGVDKHSMTGLGQVAESITATLSESLTQKRRTLLTGLLAL